MKKIVITLLRICLLLCIVFAVYKIAEYYMANQRFEQSHTQLQTNLHKRSSGASATNQELLALKALHQQYPHMVAWIRVDGTRIDFPVMQGNDNTYYLNHTYQHAYHPFGEVFMDVRNAREASDANTILYGHNVQTGQVFHDLEQYRSESFRAKHPYVTLLTLDAKKIYKIQAVYTASAYDNYRQVRYEDQQWQDFRKWVHARNLVQGSLPDRATSRILTLSTCSDDANRLVVQAEAVPTVQ